METMQAIKKALTISTFDVFEKMFYLFLEPSQAGGGQYDAVASLRFSGPRNGEILLYLPDSLACAMAENMLSLHQSAITRAMMEDCAQEAVNMIGGQFLRTLYPTKVFDVQIPVCVSHAQAAHRSAERCAFELRLHFESEKGALCLLAGIDGSEIITGGEG